MWPVLLARARNPRIRGERNFTDSTRLNGRHDFCDLVIGQFTVGAKFDGGLRVGACHCLETRF